MYLYIPGNFRLKYFRVLNFRVDTFSWVDMALENILTMKFITYIKIVHKHACAFSLTVVA